MQLRRLRIHCYRQFVDQVLELPERVAVRSSIVLTSQAERLGTLWEPLRASIGTTMGGIASIDDVNVLVEGISDQILHANLSAYLETLGRSHLDLQSSSILPYGEEISLKQAFASDRR